MATVQVKVNRRYLPLLRLPAAVLAAMIAVALASPGLVFAHAYLVKSNPAAGSLIDTSPNEIDLYFSESASLDFSNIKLYDRSRTEHRVGTPGHLNGDQTTVSVALPETLPAGTYTAVWRVVSASDGHLTAGSFAFRVRGAQGASGSTQATTPEPEGNIVPFTSEESAPAEGSAQNADPVRWGIRGIILAASAFLLGIALFTVVIIEPSAHETGKTGTAVWSVASRRSALIGASVACLLVIVLVADLVAELASIRSSTIASALAGGPQAMTLLASTTYGLAWVLRLFAAVVVTGIMLMIWARIKPASMLLWESAIGVGSLLLLGESFGSHAAATQSGHIFGLSLPILSDWLHLVTTAAWAGGLGYMVFVLFPSFGAVKLPQEERRTFLARSIPRFSRLALVSVATLAVTGTYNLAVHSTDLGAIVASDYGHVLIIKHVLLVALIGIAAVNLLKLSPRLGRRVLSQGTKGHGGPVAGLWRNVRVEAVLIGAVLVCAGGLTLLPPPNGSGSTYAAAPSAAEGSSGQLSTVASPTVAAAEASPTPLPTPGPATADTEVAGYRFSLMTRPSIDGDQLTLTLTREDKTTVPLTDVAKVFLKVTPQDVNGGSTRYQADLQGDKGADNQVWTTTQQILTLDGGYVVTAIIERTVGHDLEAGFRLDLSEDMLKASVSQVIDMRLDSVPSPPVSGTVTLKITLLDGAGSPISDAKLTVLPLMPAHGHIQPQSEATPVAGQPGNYTLPVSLQMGGSWLFVCQVERPGMPPVKVDSNLDVVDPNATPTPQGTP